MIVVLVIATTATATAAADVGPGPSHASIPEPSPDRRKVQRVLPRRLLRIDDNVRREPCQVRGRVDRRVRRRDGDRLPRVGGRLLGRLAACLVRHPLQARFLRYLLADRCCVAAFAEGRGGGVIVTFGGRWR